MIDALAEQLSSLACPLMVDVRPLTCSSLSAFSATDITQTLHETRTKSNLLFARAKWTLSESDHQQQKLAGNSIDA